MAIYDGFEPVIGLEVHAQLQTDTKIFCSCKLEFGAEPNSRTCPICLGLPGALPALNKRAAEFAVKTILAVGGTVRNRSVFARKNYFYPDLPKGYQISQYDRPIGEGGEIRYRLESGEEKAVRLIRIHLEEDAGKLLHSEPGSPYTQVDLNRCGAPLLEIVSCAEIRSPEEAYGYLHKLKQIVQYLGVCSGDMEKGHLRCDANVSVRPEGEQKLGTRTELKNMNSFKGVERALKYEIERQTRLVKSGGEVIQETLLWNEKKQVAEIMRGKEEAHDYRYFPEPDLVNLVVSDEWIAETRNSLPELPDAKAKRFVSQYGLREYDAIVLTENRPLADYYEEVMQTCADGSVAANWVQGELLAVLNETGEHVNTCRVKPKMLAELVNKVCSREISGRIAKTVFAEMIKTGKSPATVIREEGLAQISDDSAIVPLIDKILADNPDNVDKYRSGKSKVFDFFVGQVMKASKGQANPEAVNRLLKDRLEA